MANGIGVAAKSGPGQRIGSWRRGFIRRDSRGELTYYIEKQIAGKRFTISTHCDNEDEAEEHYKRFRKDPNAYAQAPRVLTAVGPPLVLDDKLAGRFLVWSEKVK